MAVDSPAAGAAVGERLRSPLWPEWAAVSTAFWLLGYSYGNWVARIPAIADITRAGPGALGAALVAITAGGAVSMPIVGRLCARRPSESVVRVAVVLMPLTLPLTALARSPLTLGLALAVFGAAQGGLDVSMNANAVAAVRRAGRPLMPAFHGMFSVGGMVGAAIGGIAAAHHVGVMRHFLIAAGAGAVIALIAGRWLPPDPPMPREPGAEVRAKPETTGPETTGRKMNGPETTGADRVTGARKNDTDAIRPTRARWRGWLSALRRIDVLLVVLGAIGFCSALGEGSVADWSALFLRNVLHTGAGTAAVGFAAFSVAMAASRFGGAAVLSRYDPGLVLTVGCALSAAGALTVVLAPAPPLAIVGFAAVGVGLSCAFPVVLNAAGAHPLGSGPAISIVTTVGYLGFLAGPPLIGAIAQATNLRWGLSAVILVSAVGAVLAARTREQLRLHDPSKPVGAGGEALGRHA